jgi:hypothetical protein
VASSVVPWPGGVSDGGDGPVPPAEIYKASIEEYRFQAQFNWSRTQYVLAFNTAILTAGTVVASQFGRVAALVFLLGLAVAVLSTLAVRTQHDYYRAARDRMRRLEAAYGIAEAERVDTTATLGRRRRAVSVNQVVYLLLAAVCVAHVAGCVLSLTLD